MVGILEPPGVRNGELVVNAARYGAGRTHVEINAAIAAVVASGKPGRVLVRAVDGPWTIGRSVSGSQTDGGILIEHSGITLESDGAELILSGNCDFMMIRSSLGAQVTITADTTITDTTVTVSSSASFAVGQWVFLRLGQAVYDAAEPDFWLTAKVDAIPDGTHVTLDRAVGYALSVAGTPTVNQRSIAPFDELVENVAIDGTWNLVNPMTGAANAESGIAFRFSRNCRVGTIIGTDCGAAVVGAQFADGLEIGAIKVKSAAAQNGQASKGRVTGFSECRGVTVGLVEAERFERSVLTAEGRSEGIKIDRMVIRNTFPGRSTTTDALFGTLGNARVQVESLHVTGAGSLLQSTGGTTGNDLTFGEAYFYTSSRPILRPGSIRDRLIVGGKLYSQRATWKRVIPLTAGMNNSVVNLPAGVLRRARVTPSTVTGLIGLLLGSSSSVTSDLTTLLTPGQSASLDQGAGFGPGYNASDDSGKRLIISTDSTLPRQAYLAVEVDYFADPDAVDGPLDIAEQQASSITRGLDSRIGTHELRSGLYYAAPAQLGSATIYPEGSARATFLPTVAAAAISKIGVSVTVAGSVGAVVRLGIWADDGSGYPSTLLLDAGTVDATTTGQKEITISLTGPAGGFWLTACTQGGAATRPTLSGIASTLMSGSSTAALIATSARAGWEMTSISGAYPSTWTATPALSGNSPLVYVLAV